MTVALVPAAGRGERLGSAGPKAMVFLHGLPLVAHAVRGLLAAGCVRHVVVAAPSSHQAEMIAALSAFDRVSVVPGGADRTASVRLALHAALEHVPDARIVLVHDAARAFTPPALVRSVTEAVAAGAPAVIPVLPVTDTVKRVDGAGVVLDTPDRTHLRAVQTPQGFDVDVLRRAYEAASGTVATDDAGLVERIGVPVHTVPGDVAAMKITTPFDLAVAEAVFAP
ncbi:MAG: 2-C-methyl-D-erythritol 4-phosphate cytidylyltransferase [Actinophytocola sp.]|uniref:2-C-methyl-D-erythritol 4-phosphate cytidylyltransferase n=1 Tax=Actinophytocola sp. TaxID=1872138 RepID=UPI003C7637B0